MSILKVSGSPHVHGSWSTKKIMYNVIYALIPIWLVSIYFFGIDALTITLISVASCLLFEWLIQKFLIKGECTIFDGSAIITGMLLAFNLPANLNPLLVILGALVAIGIGKMSFGGLGKNPFNPALVGRVFLLISFPQQMTTFPHIREGIVPDAMTGPTPLAALSENGVQPSVDYVDLLLGMYSGSFGEACALFIILGGLYLMLRRIISWHIPVAFVGSAFLFSGIFWLIDPTQYANPFFHVLAGGLMLGAVFMATDMVTSPMTPKGMLVFGCGCGILTIIIRMFGSYPEGCSFAILIMNALVPLINKWCTPKRFGVTK